MIKFKILSQVLYLDFGLPHSSLHCPFLAWILLSHLTTLPHTHYLITLDIWSNSSSSIILQMTSNHLAQPSAQILSSHLARIPPYLWSLFLVMFHSPYPFAINLHLYLEFNPVLFSTVIYIYVYIHSYTVLFFFSLRNPIPLKISLITKHLTAQVHTSHI